MLNMRMWILALLLALVGASAQTTETDSNSTASQNTTTCSSARVRRPWTSLSDDERQLYLDAIAASMDSGAYIKFSEIHTEMMSELEAHRQCMFLYWHRLFLLIFENMLRGQDPKFACVTIPYWDWITDYNKYLTGDCSNILDCSPALTYLGGGVDTSLNQTTVTINGVANTGYCDADEPLNHFCETSLVSGDECVKCVPRADWSQLTFPASASYASVRSQIFNSTNIGEMSDAIESGGHNDVHATLTSTMASFTSPSDPVFWSHHALVDAIHSIFHKCKVGEERMTMEEKIASIDWESCERRDSGTFDPYDNVTMRTGYLGLEPVNATLDELIGQYFDGVPIQFGALSDIRDLGSSSYTYELQGLLGTMYTECGASPETASRRKLERQASSSSASTSDSGSDSDSASGSDSASSSGSSSASGSGSADQPPTMGELLNTTMDAQTEQVLSWLNATDEAISDRGGDAVVEAEKMMCLFQDECLGGVTDYTDEFKKAFMITGEPRCKTIVDEIRAGESNVTLAEWKTQMTQTFGCPQPKEERERL